MRLRAVAAAGAGVGVGYALERAVLGRPRHRPDPELLAAFQVLEDAVHHEVDCVDGGRIHVVERGTPTGRPIVLLHGITLSSLSWHYQLVDLADRFRVLAVDHRGHGRSRSGPPPWGLQRLADDLVEVLERLDLRGAVVVGHSMGGMAALRLAVDRPEVLGQQVAGLVLMSTAGGPVRRLAAWKALSWIVAPTACGLALADHLPGGLFPPSDLSHLLFRLGMGPGASPTHVELNRLMTAATPPSVWAKLIGDLVAFDVLDRLGSVTVPALVVVGGRDLLTPPRVGRALAEALPDATLEVIAGAGHMVMLERRDEVNGYLARFAGAMVDTAGGR